MSKQFYLPTTDSGKVSWLKNFAEKLSVHAMAVDVDAAELASVEADRDAFEFMVEQVAFIKQDKKEFVRYKDLLKSGPEGEDIGTFPSATAPPGAGLAPVPAGIFARIGRLVNRIKNTAGYTEAIGEDLGVIGPDVNFNPDNFKTTLNAEVRNNAIRIGFIKGLVDSVVFYSRLKGDTQWVMIGVADTNPFIDTRPLENPNRPEVREYMAKGRIANVEVGLPSDIASVTFAG